MGKLKGKIVKTKLDWKGVGQVVAVLVRLSAVITTTMKSAGVSLDILDWLDGAGKEEFTSALSKLAGSYKKSLPVEVPQVTKSDAPYVIHTATVDLSVDPKSPFSGATIESNVKGNPQAVVELRSDDNLYVDGKKIILHLEPGQKSGNMKGHVLREAVSGKIVQNAALLDFLLAHVEFIPNHWKKDAAGNTRYVFFWGTVYRDSGGGLCVRCVCWLGGRWVSGYGWLADGWSVGDPAAVSAS